MDSQPADATSAGPAAHTCSQRPLARRRARSLRRRASVTPADARGHGLWCGVTGMTLAPERARADSAAAPAPPDLRSAATVDAAQVLASLNSSAQGLSSEEAAD